MKRTLLQFFVLSMLFPVALNAQTIGIAEIESAGEETMLIAGIVADSNPADGDWFLAEYEDCFGVVGYADAFVDHATGDVYSFTDISFEGVNADSLAINLYSGNSSQAFGTIIVIGDPTEGSETEPNGTPGPEAEPPDFDDDTDDNEKEVGTALVRLGYENFIDKPADNDPDWPSDPDYEEPDGKYKGKKPDYQVQGVPIELFTPDSNDPRGIV